MFLTLNHICPNTRKSMKECNINERMLGPLEGTLSLGKIQWNSSLSDSYNPMNVMGQVS